MGRNGIVLDLVKIESVNDWPRNALVVRNFLRLVGYYQCLVEGSSRIAISLTELKRENLRFVWIGRCEPGFQELK